MESIQNLQITNQQQIQQMSPKDLLGIVTEDLCFENILLESEKNFKGTDFVIALHGLPGVSLCTEKTTIEELEVNIKSYIDSINAFKTNIVIRGTNANPNPSYKYNSPQNLNICDIYIAKLTEILENDELLKSAIEKKDNVRCPILSILEKEAIDQQNNIEQTSQGVFVVTIDGNREVLTLLEIGYTYEHPIELDDQMVCSDKEEEKSSLVKVEKIKDLSEINTYLAEENDGNYDIKQITHLNKYQQEYQQDKKQFYSYKKGQRTEYPFIIEYQNGGKININLPEGTDVQNLKNYIHEDEGKLVIPKYNFIHPLKGIPKGIYPNYQMNDELLYAFFYKGGIDCDFECEDVSVQYRGSIPTPTAADGELMLYNQVKGKWNIDNDGNWRAQGDVCIKMLNPKTFGVTEYYTNNVVIEIIGKTENGLLEGNADVTIFDREMDYKTNHPCKAKYLTQIIFTKGEAPKNVQIQKQLPHGKLEITMPNFSMIGENNWVKSFADIFHNNPNTVIVHYDKDGNKTSDYTGETNEDFTPAHGVLCYANGDVVCFVKQLSLLSSLTIWDARLKIQTQDGFDYQFMLLPNQSQCIYLSKDYLKIDNTRTCEIYHKGFYYRGEHVNLVPNGDGNIQISQIQKVKGAPHHF
jgi:hypothetical protein